MTFPYYRQCALVTLLCVTALAEYGINQCDTIHHTSYSEANCSGRALTNIPWDLHSNIKILDLSNNKLSNLYNGEFTKYRSLERLYLSKNQISEIEEETFKRLLRLKYLDLSRNELRMIPTSALNLPLLSILSLRGNKLSRIEDSAFSGVPRLKILYLDGNHIRSIQQDAFKGLNYLQTLEIQNNALQNMEPGVMQYIGYGLLTLKLYNNPWFCDCRIHWLKEWLDNETHTIRWEFPNFRPLCDGPSQIRKMPFSTIATENFACPPEMYSSSEQFQLQPGSSTDLLCKYFSMPEKHPLWYKNDKLLKPRGDKFIFIEDGKYVKTSILRIKDIQEDDIAKYTCLVENKRGLDSIVFKVSLEGMDFDSVFTSPMPVPLGVHVDMKHIVISVAVVLGIVLLIVSIVLVVCISGRYKRNKAMRKQEIVREIKDHFLENEDLHMKSLDNLDGNESLSNSNINLDNTKENLSVPDKFHLMNNSLSNICRPSSPNGHTYMSFDSELTDNDELTQIYSAIRCPRHDGSHTESTTPLLEHYAPSSAFYDSRDPLENSSCRLQTFASVPRHGPYWSNTYIPRTPNNIRSNTIYNDPSFLYDTNQYHNGYHDHKRYYGDHHDSRMNFSDNRDYKNNSDYSQQHTTTMPVMHRMHPSKKSVSVGNLGLAQRSPAPRKPPRLNQVGERLLDSADDTYSEIGSRTMNNASFSEITPGTPV